MPSFTLDAEIYPLRFTVDAWLLNDRLRHHRVRDHFGPEDAKYVVLLENVGKYPAGLPVHYVIADLVARLDQLEDTNRHWGRFTGDAFLAANGTYGYGYWSVDAIAKETQTDAVSLDAWKAKGGAFTIDAAVSGMYTIDAFII